MTPPNCAAVKDLLPDFVRGELGDERRRWVVEHVTVCADCQEEVELLQRIGSDIVRVPAGLAYDIKDALAREHAPASARWSVRRSVRWRVPAAAAAVALALGTAVVWERVRSLPAVGPLGREPFAVVWPSDDADVAGAPILEGLSDDDLMLLFEELGG
jgi:anti-sigma factor RsiW